MPRGRRRAPHGWLLLNPWGPGGEPSQFWQYPDGRRYRVRFIGWRPERAFEVWARGLGHLQPGWPGRGDERPAVLFDG